MSETGAHSAKRLALLLIGNEILSGKVQDRNGFVTARKLYAAGARLLEVRAVLDIEAEIVSAIRELAGRYDYLITSGGLGPTHDDVTMYSVARALGDTVVTSQEMLAKLKAGYKDKFTDAVAKMAELPSRAQLVTSGRLDWPLIRIDNVFMLPGVPQLYERKLEAVCDLVRGQPIILREVFLKVGEAQIAETLNKLDVAYTTVDIGSYPVWGDFPYRVKITFESVDAEQVGKAVAEFEQAFAEFIVPNIDCV